MNFKRWITAHWLAITLLSSCLPTPSSPNQNFFILYRFDPPALIEYSEDFQPIREIPFSIPVSCGLFNTFAPPVGRFLAIELSCPNGQTVLFFDFETGASTQPVTASDAHFLAWTRAGDAAYLKIDSFNNPHIIRAFVRGGQEDLTIPEYTYDLAVNPINDDFTFTLSRGLGFGSELNATQYAVRNINMLYTDQFNYISFARFSHDGSQIAFIKIPDTQTPFTVGELWVMNADGSNLRKLADADAGHGFAANWSPDGKHIAFVVRENLEDESANQASDALIGNIYIVDLSSGALIQITHFTKGHAETPVWSPDGNTLAFTTVVDGRMTVSIVEVESGEMTMIESPACCPAWVQR